MFNQKFVSNFSIICFLINFTLSQLILSLPIIFSRVAGTAAYLVSIYIAILIFLLMSLMTKLYHPFWGLNIFTIAKYAFGNIGSKILSSLYTIIFVILTVFFLREVSETMKILLFDTTPILIISLFFTVSMIIGATAGLEGIVRACGYIIPIAILGVIITLIFAIPYFDINRLYPLVGHGLSPILTDGLLRISAYLGFIYLFDFVNYVRDEKEFKKIYTIYVIISFILITITLLANTLIFAYPYTDSNFFALYEIAKLTTLNSFFLRSEIIYIFTLMIISFMFIISLYYATLNFFNTTISTKTNIWTNIAIGVIIFALSNIPDNLLQVFNYYNVFNNYILIPIAFVLPFLIVAIANIKRLKDRSGYEKFVSCFNNTN